MAKLESKFEHDLMQEIEAMFPGCVIQKNDPHRRQGVPDRLILWGPHWAVLEVKRSATAKERPNQRWYVEQWNEMSFASFIFPENKEEVLDALQRAFGNP